MRSSLSSIISLIIIPCAPRGPVPWLSFQSDALSGNPLTRPIISVCNEGLVRNCAASPPLRITTFAFFTTTSSQSLIRRKAQLSEFSAPIKAHKAQTGSHASYAKSLAIQPPSLWFIVIGSFASRSLHYKRISPHKISICVLCQTEMQ